MSLNDRFRTRLLEATTDVVAVVDENGRFTHLSPESERRLDYERGALDGESGLGYVHPDDRGAVKAAFETLVDSSRDRLSTDFRFERGDGSWLWLDADGRDLRDDPDIEGIVVTANERPASRTCERDELVRAIDDAPVGVTLTDPTQAENPLVYVNDQFTAMTGYEERESLGRNCRFLQGAETEPANVAALREAVSNGESASVTLRNYRNDGTEFWNQVSIAPLTDDSGRVTRYVGFQQDITERKQYEQTLAALTDTSQELLAAESRSEVADCLVDTARTVLSLSVAAVYLFDADTGRLRPQAVGSETAEGTALDALATDRSHSVGETFLDQQPREITDPDDPVLSALSLRSGLSLPLGDHGVCVLGHTDAELDADERELASMLRATAETALDRVATERRLRDRERSLERETRKLARANEFNTAVREIDATLMQADTREEITEAVTEQLAAVDGIELVWIGGEESRQGRIVPRTWDGEVSAGQYLDEISLVTDSTEPTVEAADTGAVTRVQNIAEAVHDGDWQTAALARGFQSALCLPLTYKDISYGTLSLYADQPEFFDDLSWATLRDLSNRVANASNAVDHQRAVHSERTTEVTIQLAETSIPVYAIASRADCTLTVERTTTQSDGSIQQYVSIADADTSTVADAARELAVVTAVSVEDASGDTDLLGIRYTGDLFSSVLADRGLRVQTLTADAETATVTVLVPDAFDVSRLFETLAELELAYELVSKRDRTPTPVTADDPDRFRSQLTPRQQEVLDVAYQHGFFESPRECTGEDLADRLDVSAQTVYRHLRTAQRKLIQTVFEDADRS